MPPLTLLSGLKGAKLLLNMNDAAQRIRDYLAPFYPLQEWPTLLSQAEEWAESRPLEGLRIVDATPLYRNTLGKFMALLAAGAELYVPWKSSMPTDPAVVAMLPQFGIRRAAKGDNFFDIVLDCAGQCKRLKPALGAVELTRSGVDRYERATFPVFNVDGGRIKRIETTLGTGESFVRAMAKLGHRDLAGRRLLVVGFGKVGRGIAYYARKAGMKVCVADAEDLSAELPEGAGFVSACDTEAFNAEILRSWCVVTATGQVSALRRRLHAAAVIDSPVLLANLGVDDEFGPAIPDARVLNNKKPLNFILEEPTRMRFIETTMALHNACALELLTPDLPHRCLAPRPDVEERLLAIACEQGCIGGDVAAALAH